MTGMTETARLPDPRPADRWSLFGIALALVALRIVGFLLIAALVVTVALLVIWVGLPLLLGLKVVVRRRHGPDYGEGAGASRLPINRRTFALPQRMKSAWAMRGRPRKGCPAALAASSFPRAA